MTVTVNFTLGDEVPARSCADEHSMRSPDGTPATAIDFMNQADTPRKVYWLDGVGARHWFQTLEPQSMVSQTTYVGHTWVVTDMQDVCTAIYVAMERRARASIGSSIGRRVAGRARGHRAPDPSLREGFQRFAHPGARRGAGGGL